MLEKYQVLLSELKKQSRGTAILNQMKNTLENMKGELEQCYKPY